MEQPRPSHEARKIDIEDAQRFERDGFTGFIHMDLKEVLRFSCLTRDVNGEHPTKRMLEGTRSYYVAEGQGTFTLGDEVHHVQSGNLFVIPSGGVYSYEGVMTLFEFNIPSAEGNVLDEKLD